MRIELSESLLFQLVSMIPTSQENLAGMRLEDCSKRISSPVHALSRISTLRSFLSIKRERVPFASILSFVIGKNTSEIC